MTTKVFFDLAFLGVAVYKRKSLSLETVEYQLRDTFPSKLAAIIERLYDSITDRKYKDTETLVLNNPDCKAIDKLIFDRFKLNVELQHNLHALSPAAIIPFFGDYYKVNKSALGFFKFNGLNLVKTIEKIIKDREEQSVAIHNKEGYIDLKTARVGGYLSEVKHYLIIDFVLMQSLGITPMELTAIIMHELGHAFDGLEEHYRISRTNRAIYDILIDLNNNKVDNAKYKYRHFFSKEYFDKSTTDVKDVREDFATELAHTYLGEIGSQLQHNKYNETNYENMSDTFATRFGLGKDLVSALDKLMRNSGRVYDRYGYVGGVNAFLDIMLSVLMFAAFGAAGGVVFVICMVHLNSISETNYTYDTPLDRYNRIKNTIVNALKRSNLPKEVVKNLLDQLEYIQTLMENSSEYKNLYESIADRIHPGAIQAKYYIDLQKRIENNLNNQLFVKSAQLQYNT